MLQMSKKFFGKEEAASGGLNAEDYASIIVKIAVLLIIGIFLINGIVSGANITADSPFYSAYESVQTNLTNGYGLASLMVLVIASAGIMHFLGFM